MGRSAGYRAARLRPGVRAHEALSLPEQCRRCAGYFWGMFISSSIDTIYIMRYSDVCGVSVCYFWGIFISSSIDTICIMRYSDVCGVSVCYFWGMCTSYTCVIVMCVWYVLVCQVWHMPQQQTALIKINNAWLWNRGAGCGWGKKIQRRSGFRARCIFLVCACAACVCACSRMMCFFVRVRGMFVKC